MKCGDYKLICDIIIIFFVLITLFFGWKKGFVRSAYSVLSLVICLLAMYFFKAPFAHYLARTQFGKDLGEMLTSSYVGFAADECVEALMSAISVICIYFAAKITLQFVFRVLDSLTSLPLIHGFNQVLGLIVNGVAGLLWIVVLVNLFYALPQTQNAILESKIINEFNVILIK